MKDHKGMRPQDIVILLKILALGDKVWQNKDLAYALYMSPSEITESLNRSQIAGLIDPARKMVFTNSLVDFLVHGLRYVFPAQPGALVKGIPTAHSSPAFKKDFNANENYVWADAEGYQRGQAIEPLYKTVPKAVKTDRKLYDLLAIADTFRIGRTREIKAAKEKLERIIKANCNVPSY